jgi:hypothetical protein
MSVPAPPKAKRAPAKSAFPKLRLAQNKSRSGIAQARCFMRFLRIVQSPFNWAFWLIEQRIARIEDKLSREKCCQ